ncbi:hypothetical protein [Nonomuraea dietziae]|uniref:hypothetical protein n=1 Tax=Nonomuraea dietziae TaxID=65515 RepID=UPI00343A74C8
MDLAKSLRALQEAADQADRDLAAARAAADTAASAYDQRRRYAPSGKETDRARQAWGMALHEWAHALFNQAAARDQLAAERRDVDRAAEDALLTPTRRT